MYQNNKGFSICVHAHNLCATCTLQCYHKQTNTDKLYTKKKKNIFSSYITNNYEKFFMVVHVVHANF